MPRATLAATAVGLAAVLLLAGCGPDGPEPPPAASESTTPGPSLSASPSVSPSPTSTVAPPERPAEMDDDGPAGAEAAAVYFLELDAYMMKTGDTAEWKLMSHDECDRCAARLGQAEEILERKDRWEGGEIKARVLHTYEQDRATGIWPMDVEISVSSVRVVDSAGNEVFADEAAVTESRVEMILQDDEWAVFGVVPKTQGS